MKRVKVNRKCPNPLFIAWLEEWKADANSRGSEMQFCFGKALNTLKKFPLPLKSGRECILLENFGPKLCAMLDRKLADYKAANINNSSSAREEEYFHLEHNKPNFEKNSYNNAEIENKEKNINLVAAGRRAKQSEVKEQPNKKARTSNAKENGRRVIPNNRVPYIPAWRSGGYAILLALYEKSQDPDYPGYMKKADLQTEAQKYCNKSLKKAEPGTRYSAWSSMSTLIRNGLVISKSNPAKYSLTDAGFAAAMQLSEADENDSMFGTSAQCNNSSQSGGETSAALGEKRLRQMESAAPPSEDGDEDLEFISSDPIPSYNYDGENIEEEFSAGDNGREILSDNNNRHVSKENKIPSWQINQDNHLQTLDINEQTNSQQSASSNDEQRNVILRPRTFDIILLVDDRETAGGKTYTKDDITIAALTKVGVRFEVRNLKIGDFAWIARCRDTSEELILPHIVERKRIDDFGGSIKDGRYHEQKFRLKKSGIQNITYLIENHGNNQFPGLPMTTLSQAAINTLVQDGFTVKYTKSHKQSIFYLGSVTDMLTKIYREKTLVGSKKEDLTPVNIANDLIQLMVFEDFNKAAAKVKTFRAKDMFMRQLVQLKGMSLEKASAIVDSYSTPKALKKAFDEAGSSGENLLAGIQFGKTKRQLGPALSKTLHQFYTRKDF